MSESMKRTKVYQAYDRIQAEMILGALENNQIAAYRQGIGSGGYMDVLAGNSIFGEDIYVDEADVQKAKEIIESITAEIDEEPEE